MVEDNISRCTSDLGFNWSFDHEFVYVKFDLPHVRIFKVFFAFFDCQQTDMHTKIFSRMDFCMKT